MLLASNSVCPRVALHLRIRLARLRSSAFTLSVMLLALCLLIAGPLAAQTAHFASAQTIVATGLNTPYGLTRDSNGNIFFADNGGNSVKEVLAVNGVIPASPTVRTLATGFNYPVNAGVDMNGNVFVDDHFNNAVKEIVAVGGVIPASPTIRTIGSGFNQPQGMMVDSSGDVYIFDANNFSLK